MTTAIQGGYRFQKASDLMELAVRATMGAKTGAAAPTVSAGQSKDGVSFSDGARSKIAELAKTIEAQPGRGVTATDDGGIAYGVEGDAKDKLRKIWSEDLSGLTKAKEHSQKSIEFSRDKGEVWLYDSSQTDPSKQFYRMENQPENFESYMELRESAYKSYDTSIASLREMIAGLDEPTPVPVDMTA